MDMISLFYIFLTALMTSLIMIPPISHLSVRIGGIDKPSERKVHFTETPRLGGIAIFCAFLFSVLFFIDIDRQIKGFLAGSVVIFLTGLADDLNGLSPRCKLVGEAIAATLTVVSGGISLNTVGDPFGLGPIHLGIFSVPFTVFAVVGVMNAINLIDGLDGLAGGTSAVACLAFSLFFWKSGNLAMVALLVALLGAIAGFLHYNTYPARIFMGDSGSLFLGYCMGFFSVLLLNSGGGVSPIAPLMILGVPILDTLVVMGRRIRRGEPVTSPDKTHLHHQLLNLGFGHRFSVVIVYCMSYVLAASALLLHGTSDRIQASVLIIFFLLLYSVLKVLDKSEWGQRITLLRSNRTILHTDAYRKIVGYSRFLVTSIKYSLLFILILVIFVLPNYPTPIVWAAGLLLMLMLGLLLIGSGWGNFLLQSVIYFSGLICVFIMENYGRKLEIGGIPLLWVSHLLFALLLCLVAIKIILRKRTGHLMNSSFEHLILFVVVAVPLLPYDFTASFHLLSVAAKSVIMFVAYKLLLMRQARKNRKVLAATFVALLALIFRHVVHL